MNIINVPMGIPLIHQWAKHMIKTYPQEIISKSTVILPTKRSIHVINKAFLNANKGKACLLPRCITLSDEQAMPSSHTPTLKPIASKIQCVLEISAYIRPLAKNTGMSSITLAQELYDLWAELTLYDIEPRKLSVLKPMEVSAHWAQMHAYLEVIITHLPALLAERGEISIIDAQKQGIKHWIDTLRQEEAPYPIIALNITRDAPIYGSLLNAIAKQPKGSVLFQGIHANVPNAQWDTLQPSSPQYPFKRMLEVMHAKRADVQPASWARQIDNKEALAHAVFMEETQGETIEENDNKHISTIIAKTDQDEAISISIAIRQTLEQNEKTVALITNNTSLARQVTHHLGQWGIYPDDSKGKRLMATPAGLLFLNMAKLMEQDYALPELMDLLRNPKARPWDAETLDYTLRDKILVRQGIKALAKAVATNEDARNIIENVRVCTEKLYHLWTQESVDAEDILRMHVQTVEQWAGGLSLYEEEDGHALHTWIKSLLPHWNILGRITPKDYITTLQALLAQEIVYQPYGYHHRVSLWGIMESRMQQADRTILGGLNENSFPKNTPPSPWLNNAMRQRIGLPSNYASIGLDASDFARLISGPEVILTRCLKDGDTITTPSRFWKKLEITRNRLGLKNHISPYETYTMEQLPAKIIEKPAIMPQEHVRQTTISITDIDNLLENPYHIFAQRMLKLKPLSPIATKMLPNTYGSIIHKIIEDYHNNKASIDDLIKEAFEDFDGNIMTEVFQKIKAKKILQAFEKTNDIMKITARSIHTEASGIFTKETRNKPITIKGKADLIVETMAKIYTIIDYKTGAANRKSWQLPALKDMLEENGFKDIGIQGVATVLEYWEIKYNGVQRLIPDEGYNTVPWEDIASKLYTEPITASTSGKNLEKKPYYHLSRVGEWEQGAMTDTSLEAEGDDDDI